MNYKVFVKAAIIEPTITLMLLRNYRTSSKHENDYRL